MVESSFDGMIKACGLASSCAFCFALDGELPQNSKTTFEVLAEDSFKLMPPL